MFGFYEADLTTSMTVQEQTVQLRSFTDVANSDYQMVVRQGTAQHEVLKLARKGTPLQRIYSSMTTENKISSSCQPDCQSVLLKEHPEYILFASAIDAQQWNHAIGLKFDDSIPDYLSFGFPQDSEFVDLFNKALLEMKENGILDSLVRKWIVLTSNHVNRWELVPESGTTLGFENLSFPFLGLAFSMFVSCVLSLFEKLSGRKQHATQKLVPHHKFKY